MDKINDYIVTCENNIIYENVLIEKFLDLYDGNKEDLFYDVDILLNIIHRNRKFVLKSSNKEILLSNS